MAKGRAWRTMVSFFFALHRRVCQVAATATRVLWQTADDKQGGGGTMLLQRTSKLVSKAIQRLFLHCLRCMLPPRLQYRK